jgi:GT2 family glycosyltransferase
MSGTPFILIMSTLGRTDDLVRFFRSLAAQGDLGCKVYLCDQNDDGRLEPILSEWSERLSIRVVRSEPGLSRGRNAALKTALADLGPEKDHKDCIVAFPDDDCWYSNEVLPKVASILAQRPEASGITARSVNERGVPSAASSPNTKMELTPRNLFRGSMGISYCIFLRLEVVRRVGFFNETLGVGSGTPWGAGEESDYLLRAMRQGARIFYEPAIQVHHPDKAPLSDPLRFLSYARGHGRVLRLNGYSWGRVGKDVFVALAAFLVKSVREKHLLYPYLYRAWGYITGYYARIPR